MKPNPSPNRAQSSGASPAARDTSEWFRQVERLVRLSRAHGAEFEDTVELSDRLVRAFAALVERHAPLVLRCTPVEIWLRDERVLHHVEEAGGEPLERGVPFLLFRDGVRGLTLDITASAQDARTLLSSLVRVASAPATSEDLTTLLWSADLDGLCIELAPLGELVPGSHEPGPGDSNPELPAAGGLGLVEGGWQPDSYPGEGAPVDVSAAWNALEAVFPEALAQWGEAWDAAAARRWTERVEMFVNDVLERDGGPAAREALTTSLCSWIAGAAQRCDWYEAAAAQAGLRLADPERQWCRPLLRGALGALDAELVAERLDEAGREDQNCFFVFAVRAGHPALDLIIRVLARSARQRVRAAATTALSYACADDAAALAPYLRDSRWQVARNVVFALGQLGGEQAGEPLAFALRHADVRVRRAAVAALGHVPVHRRTLLLLPHLDSPDPGTVAAVLALLAREPDRRASAALMERIGAADFESRPEAARLAMLATLGDTGDPLALPALNTVLMAGGWFAHATPDRGAAARAIARIGTPAAIKLLSAGLHARADAVREACREALYTVRSERSA